MADIDSIWGTTVIRFEVRLETMSITIHLKARDLGVEHSYVLRCSGISELSLTNDIQLPWDCAELSEAHAVERPDGRWEVHLEFWSDGCLLHCACDSYSVVEVLVGAESDDAL